MADIKYTLLSTHDALTWDSFASRTGLVYHSTAWGKVIEQAYGYPVRFLALLNDSDDIIAGMPICTVSSRWTGRRLSSFPGAHICGPIGKPEVLQPLIDELLETAKRSKCPTIEIRSDHELALSAGPEFECIQEYVTHILELTGNADDAWKGFHKSCIQRVIRKAERSDIHILRRTERRDLHDFYTLYLGLRKENGLLPQPFRYFEAMRNMLEPEGRFHLRLAKQNDLTISAMLLLSDSSAMRYEYGATLQGKKRLGASSLLIWDAIKMAVDKGMRKFDFGRSSLSNENLRLFKSRWGAQERPLRYYYYPRRRGISAARRKGPLSHIMAAVMTVSPSSVSRLLGSIFYKHVI